MGSDIIGTILNIRLDPLFIFQFGMGVKGAALATIIAQACSAAWVLLLSWRVRKAWWGSF